jgi:hypothetical protein
LPLNSKVEVALNQTVLGGVTVIARFDAQKIVANSLTQVTV